MAGFQNIDIDQGATLRYRFVWTDSTGAPVNLTGASCRMQIRAKQSTASTLLSDVTQYLTLTAAAGQVDLVVPGSTTSTWTFRNGHYSLRVDRPGDNKRLIEGSVSVSMETTV